jgi:hypothetical protein
MDAPVAEYFMVKHELTDKNETSRRVNTMILKIP